MQKIDIYDCYTRNAAGFQNVLQDLKFGSETPKSRWHDSRRKDINKWNNEITWGLSTWFFVFMCHRITGSGASFENDHGYRNNIMQYWGTQFGKLGVKEMCEDLVKMKANQPIFTSIGNQPPAPKKGTTNVDFMTKELPPLIYRFTDWLLYEKIDGREMKTHKEIVDYLNAYNKTAGHRKFNFQYAAFSMDCIEKRAMAANKARTEILADNPEINSEWTPDAEERMNIIGQNGNDGLHYPPPGPDGYTPGPGPLDGEQAKIDWTKDSEYIRLYGKEGNKKI